MEVHVRTYAPTIICSPEYVRFCQWKYMYVRMLLPLSVVLSMCASVNGSTWSSTRPRPSIPMTSPFIASLEEEDLERSTDVERTTQEECKLVEMVDVVIENE